MERTVTQLADGRELIYYRAHTTDIDGGWDTAPVDPRQLPAPAPPSELRYDPLLDEWVAVAVHRQDRTFLPPSDECPLCPSTPARATEIPAYDYQVVAFENRFPAFSHRGSASPTADSALTEIRPGIGRCEVVCFTSEHSSSFATLSRDRVRLVVDVWADRTADLSQLPGVAQVFCFENRGEDVGVTLHHPHGQIYACPVVAPRTRQMLRSARAYERRTTRNLFADVLTAERAADVRIVATNAHWTAFVPTAARWPFEVHLYPHRQVPDIATLSGDERDAFGPLYLDVLRGLDRVFDVAMPYMSAWHQAPVGPDRDLAYLHLQLFSNRRAPGRLKYLASSEAAMGMFLNDIAPEQAAQLLREAIPPLPA